MSEQQIPVTYESVLELIRQVAEQMRVQTAETDRKFQEMTQETDRKFQETSKQIERTSKEVGGLTSSVGRLVENMVGGGNIVAQFRDLGHNVIAHSRNKNFGEPGTDTSGEIDLFLEDGGIAILIEVKTTLKTDDVREHIERMEKYRSWIDANGGDKKRYIGAIAAASVADDTIKYAHRCGMYVIVQTGDAFKIVAQPKGFKAKEW